MSLAIVYLLTGQFVVVLEILVEKSFLSHCKSEMVLEDLTWLTADNVVLKQCSGHHVNRAALFFKNIRITFLSVISISLVILSDGLSIVTECVVTICYAQFHFDPKKKS